MVNNAAARRYFREVKKSIPCDGKQKKCILKQVNTSIQEYLSEIPDSSYDDIVNRFGTPDQIAATYIEELDVSDLKEQLSVRKRIICAVVAVAIVVVGIWAGAVVHALRKYGDAMPGYIERTVEVIEQEGGNYETDVSQHFAVFDTCANVCTWCKRGEMR